MDFLRETLDQLAQAGLLRTTRRVESAQGAVVRVDGRDAVCLCSNNYLSLASRPELVEAAAEAARRFGCGGGASRLVSGTMALHEELEAAIARLKSREAALLFPTGYMANVGAISALVAKGDAVAVDKLNHASIIDGCRLSGARLLVCGHRDPQRLDDALASAAGLRRRLAVTDSVFSMDGDIAPLPELADACRRHGAMLMIDEAHATGVLGETGRGTEEYFGAQPADVVMGTLSKALGSLGGFVAGSRELIGLLRNTARSFIYTTSLPPPVCAASLAAIELISRDTGPLRRLRSNIALLDRLLRESGLADAGSPAAPAAQHLTPIFPVVIGDAARAMEVSRRLFEAGCLCPAIRPPTVPAGTSRLRVSLQSDHTEEQIRGFVIALREALRLSR